MCTSPAFTERIRPSRRSSTSPSPMLSVICAAKVPGDRIE